MGLVAKVISFVRTARNNAMASDVQVDPGGGPIVTAEHFSAPGDDAFPLTTDYLAAVTVQQTGRWAVVGYLDPLNTPQALAGDKRIYARDSSGAAVVEVWLKNTGEALTSNSNGSVTLRPDGSILGQNAAGSFELQAGGDFVVNGVTITAAGQVIVPTSLTVNGVEVADHNHTQANDGGGNTEADTGVMQ